MPTRSTPLTDVEKKTFREAIEKLHRRGVYPSFLKLNMELGRNASGFSGTEREFVIAVFEELGIRLRSHH